MKFQVEVLCFVTPCSIVVGYQRFRRTCFLHFQGGGIMNLWNVGTRPQNYTASQPWRSQLESSRAWKTQNSHKVWRRGELIWKNI